MYNVCTISSYSLHRAGLMDMMAKTSGKYRTPFKEHSGQNVYSVLCLVQGLDPKNTKGNPCYQVNYYRQLIPPITEVSSVSRGIIRNTCKRRSMTGPHRGLGTSIFGHHSSMEN